jgi:hypothetical protein
MIPEPPNSKERAIMHEKSILVERANCQEKPQNM